MAVHPERSNGAHGAQRALHPDAPLAADSEHADAAAGATGQGQPPAEGWQAVLGELRELRRALQTAFPAELLDADAAAAFCGLSRSTFYVLIAQKKLPRAIELGTQLRRWRRSELLKALDGL